MSKFKSLLWLVVYLDHDGDADGPNNYDLLVIATSDDQAVELWRKHFQESGDSQEDDPERWNEWAVKKPDGVWRIPEHELLNRTPRALQWGEMECSPKY